MTEANTTTKEKDPLEGMLHVLDTTATPEHPQRIHHQLVDGLPKPFTFKNGEPLALPIDLALKFLPTESFLVTDPKTGERLNPNPRTPGAGEELVLQSDQVVANLSELSQKALLLRAKQLPDGERYTQSTKREVLIAALVKVNAAKVVAVSSDPEQVTDSEGLGAGAMPQGQLDKLFADVED